MSDSKKIKGTWGQRFFIIFLSLVLGVLLFWLLGFLTRDIGSLRGPVLSKVEAKYLDTELVKKQRFLKLKLDAINGNIRNRKEEQKLLKDSTDSLQNTINQLLTIQKQGIEKGLEFPAESRQTLTENQGLFLENQRQYQALNKKIVELTTQRRQLEKDLASVSKQVDKQRDLAGKEYSKLMGKHRLKVAALKLAVLVPIFLILAWLFVKKRSGTYGPIVYAAFIAAFLKLAFVVHEYFPRRYFKYIAILVIIGIVLKLLIYLLKRVVSPKKDWLIKQYQEAYDKGVCAICGKPVRIGPLRYAMKGKGSGLILVGEAMASGKQQVYSCPSCGTKLYEECDKCSDIRHSLLPFCEHCGNEKAKSP